MLLQGKERLFHAPPTYETLSVNAHTPLHIYIFSITDRSDSWKNGSQVYGDKRHRNVCLQLKIPYNCFSLFRSPFILDNTAYWIPTRL